MSNGNVFAVTSEQAGGVELEPGGRQQVVFNVQNISGRPLEGRAGVRVDLPAQRGWYAIQGRTERRFGEDEVHQFVVEIAIPEDAREEGRYTFELECVGVERPDESFGRSEKVLVIVRQQRVVADGGVPMWVWIAAAAVVLLVGGLAAWFFTGRGKVEVPQLVGQPVEEALAVLDSLGLALGNTTLELQVGQREPIVLVQEPDSGTSVRRGSPVDLTIAHRAEVMPRLLGDSYHTALRKLARLGSPFLPVPTTDGPRDSTVHRQIPNPGDTIAFGDSIVVTFTMPPVIRDPRDLVRVFERGAVLQASPAFRGRFFVDTAGSR